MATALSPTVVMLSPNTLPTLHLSSAKTGQSRETAAIQFRDCYNGIGIKIIGGAREGVTHGIFIKRLLRDGKALLDGRLRIGDQLMRVNGQSLEVVTYSDSLQVLREAAASGQATLVVSRDDKSQREFITLMEDELTTASESSRATTPLNAMDSSDGTLISDSSLSHDPSPPPNNQSQQPLMNNNQSGLTRTLSHNSANRQDIQRLANFFSHKLAGSAAMASTPYDLAKETNQQRGRSSDTTQVSNRERASHQHPLVDSLFAQQLLTSIHSDSQQSNLRTPGHTIQALPPVQQDTRCSFQRLETALSFLGLTITEEQKALLRSALQTDSQGLVSYAQFVQVAKQLFHDDLRHWEVPSASAQPPQPPSRAPGLPLPQRSFYSPLSSPLTRVTRGLADSYGSDLEAAGAAGVNVVGADIREEIRQLQQENFALRKQIHVLSKQLNDQTQLTSNAERELLNFRAEAQHALEATTSLNGKLLLATESQKIASQQEQEFERVIEGLEEEIGLLKENEAKQMESPTVRKKLAVMGSQLRKSEESRKTYYIATQKLLDYCQHVHDAMSGRAMQSGTESRLTPQHMAAEASSTMTLVRNLLERDPLPFGWEECYNEGGSRYFINHVTQETSWQHPISRLGAPLTPRTH